MLLSIFYCMFAICRAFVWLVLAANSLRFCFSDKVFISPSLLKDNFVAHRIPDWWLFSFSFNTVNIVLPLLRGYFLTRTSLWFWLCRWFLSLALPLVLCRSIKGPFDHHFVVVFGKYPETQTHLALHSLSVLHLKSLFLHITPFLNFSSDTSTVYSFISLLSLAVQLGVSWTTQKCPSWLHFLCPSA